MKHDATGVLQAGIGEDVSGVSFLGSIGHLSLRFLTIVRPELLRIEEVFKAPQQLFPLALTASANHVRAREDEELTISIVIR